MNQITARAECPQINKSGFIYSYAYAADVPLDLPVKHTSKFFKNCSKFLKSGTVFNMGECEADTIYLFTDTLKK